MTTRIRHTVLYLLLIQGGNYLFPLLLLPFLGRVLGVEEFGVLAYCQAVVQYLILLTDYGYNQTATRQVALSRDHPGQLAQVFSATMAARLALTLLSLALLLAGVVMVPSLAAHWPILAAAFIGVVATAVTPIWLFQGMERMRELVLPTFVSKLASLLVVLALVRGHGDAALAAFGISMGNVILAAAALWCIRRKRLVSFERVSGSGIVASLRDGFPVFLSLVMVSFYVNFNVILLNYFHGPAAVGQFSMADKIRVAAQTVFTVVGQAFFPRVSLLYATDRAAADALMRKAMVAVFGCATALFIVIFVCAGWGMRVWAGEQFMPAAHLLRLEALMLPIISVAYIFGSFGLLALGRTAQIRNVYVAVSLLHLVYVGPLVKFLGAEGAVLSVMLTEIAGAAAFAWLYRRYARSGLPTPARGAPAVPAAAVD